MGLRPAKCYRSLSQRAYSRTATRVHRRNYIGTSPGIKVRQWNMGNGVKLFSHIANLHADEGIIIRDNAIESARMTANRHLVKLCGKDNFFMKVRVFPFDVLRENKQAQGAGADRVTKGMAHCFGKPIGRGARVRPNKILFSVLINEDQVQNAIIALLKAKSRFPCKVHVEVGTNVESIGTRPKKTRDMLAIEKEAQEKAAGTTEAAAETTEKKDEKAKDAKAIETKTEEPKKGKGKKK